MSNIQPDPVPQTFADAIREVIDGVREKPLDDRPTFAEMIGVLQYQVHQLCCEADERGRRAMDDGD